MGQPGKSAGPWRAAGGAGVDGHPGDYNSRLLRMPGAARSFRLGGARGPVGAVVRARDSQRRVRPGRTVAAGPPPGSTLRRRRREGGGCRTRSRSRRVWAFGVSATQRRSPARQRSGWQKLWVGRQGRARWVPRHPGRRVEGGTAGLRGETHQPGRGRGLPPGPLLEPGPGRQLLAVSGLPASEPGSAYCPTGATWALPRAQAGLGVLLGEGSRRGSGSLGDQPQGAADTGGGLSPFLPLSALIF